MLKKKALSRAIAATSLLGSATIPAIANAQQVIEEIVVTAQKRAESIQDVPIAVSAFSQSELEYRQIDTAVDLQNYVPNMNYVGGGDYSIRGVGAAVGGTTGDVGVGVHINNIPIIVNRTTTGELYDLERVEVLRGPQGTLYGRNATGGVVNFLVAKPDFNEVSGSITTEVGSFDSIKFQGYVNLPASEVLAFRLAGSFLQRDGYTENLATGNDIDGRDQWSTRFSMTFAPTDEIESTLMWEHFEEDSSRNGGARRFCVNDPGPSTVGSTPVNSAAARLYLSRGCAEGSVYDPAAYDNANSVATFGGRYAFLLGLVPGDVFANQPQSTDPREVSYYFDPEYLAENDFVSWDTRFDLTNELQLNLLMGWAEDKSDTRSGSEEANIGFVSSPLTPGGIFTDYQGGPASGIRTLQTTDNYTEQFSTELRLQSDFDSPVNFNLGAFYLDVERHNTLFISTNSTSLFALASGAPLYFDTNPDPRDSDYNGHQYFVSQTPYQLESKALFGEVYWDINDSLKLTAGLRYSDDEKQTDIVPILLFIPQGANGIGTAGHPPTGPSSIRPQSVDFQENTGRIVLDWRPDVEFSDDTLIYASYSTGYKAGGFNSPDDPADSQSFTPYLPEFVKAFEIGTKNVFAGGRNTVNLTAFYYDYEDYQISFIEQFSARNTNVDAEVLGLELETSFEVVDNLILSANVGWQDSEIKGGTSVDPFDRLQDQPGLTYLVTPQNGCVVETAALEPLIALINVGAVPASILANAAAGPNDDICEGAYAGPGNPLAPFGVDITPSAGVPTDVKGNELPNLPRLSYTLGASYTFPVGNWEATLRGDYSWKDDSYTSHFNGENYELQSWRNANLSFVMQNFDMGLAVHVFAKNVLNDDDTVIGYDLSGQGLGLARNATLLDPRLFGVSVRYDF